MMVATASCRLVVVCIGVLAAGVRVTEYPNGSPGWLEVSAVLLVFVAFTLLWPLLLAWAALDRWRQV